MRRLLGAFSGLWASILASRALLAMCVLLSFSTNHVTIIIAIIWLLGTVLAGDRRSTFVQGRLRTKGRRFGKSSFGPEMGGRDPVLHYSSDAGVAGCLIGAPEVFA